MECPEDSSMIVNHRVVDPLELPTGLFYSVLNLKIRTSIELSNPLLTKWTRNFDGTLNFRVRHTGKITFRKRLSRPANFWTVPPLRFLATPEGATKIRRKGVAQKSADLENQLLVSTFALIRKRLSRPTKFWTVPPLRFLATPEGATKIRRKGTAQNL